jgi:hypothetical protein
MKPLFSFLVQHPLEIEEPSHRLAEYRGDARGLREPVFILGDAFVLVEYFGNGCWVDTRGGGCRGIGRLVCKVTDFDVEGFELGEDGFWIGVFDFCWCGGRCTREGWIMDRFLGELCKTGGWLVYEELTLSTGIVIVWLIKSELDAGVWMFRVGGGSELARLLRCGNVMENLPPMAVEREMFMP